MTKSFLFVIFSIGCLIVQASCAEPTETQTKPDQDTNQLGKAYDSGVEEDSIKSDGTSAESSDNTENDGGKTGIKEEGNNELPLPFLTCLLFENDSACSGTCSLIGSIYGQPITSGVCGEHNDCICNISPAACLDNYWAKKFDSSKLLPEIRKDETLSEKIFAVLKTPFRTPQETISDLKPYLSEEQLKSLQPKDKEAQKLFAVDGKFDHNAVRRYINRNLKSLKKSSQDYDFRKTLNTALYNSDVYAFDHIHDEIRRSGNQLLNKTLDQFMENGNISSPPDTDGDKENLIDLLDSAVANKFLAPLPHEKSAPSRYSILNLSSSRVTLNKPDSTNSSSELNENWWKLQGFNKISTSALQRGKKCWQVTGYYDVCLIKSDSVQWLSWKNTKDSVAVEMEILNGEIRQSWTFPEAVIDLNRIARGTKIEKWVLGKSKYEVTKNSKGEIQSEKWHGKKVEGSLGKYKQFINTWCAENDYILGKDNCIIY